MLRKLLLIPLVFVLLLLQGSQTAGNPDAILGVYWTPSQKGKIEMYKVGEAYFGRLAWGETENDLDIHNPNPSLRSRKLKGINIFEGFTYDPSDDKWVDGTVYDTRTGKIYDCELWFEEGNLNSLYARGFIGFSLFGATRTFDRVE